MQTFISAIHESKLNSLAIIPIVEDVINLEKTNLEANKIIHDEFGCLRNEYRIAHAQILLSLLRMQNGDLS